MNHRSVSYIKALYRCEREARAAFSSGGYPKAALLFRVADSLAQKAKASGEMPFNDANYFGLRMLNEEFACYSEMVKRCLKDPKESLAISEKQMGRAVEILTLLDAENEARGFLQIARESRRLKKETTKPRGELSFAWQMQNYERGALEHFGAQDYEAAAEMFKIACKLADNAGLSGEIYWRDARTFSERMLDYEMRSHERAGLAAYSEKCYSKAAEHFNAAANLARSTDASDEVHWNGALTFRGELLERELSCYMQITEGSFKGGEPNPVLSGPQLKRAIQAFELLYPEKDILALIRLVKGSYNVRMEWMGKKGKAAGPFQPQEQDSPLQNAPEKLHAALLAN